MHEHEHEHNHDEHAGHSPDMFRQKFWLSLILTIPVLYWSQHIQDLIGFTAFEFSGSEWIPAALGSVVFLYGGTVFLKGAWHELRQRLPGMMTLISLAITVAFVFSVVVDAGVLDAQSVAYVAI